MESSFERALSSYREVVPWSERRGNAKKPTWRHPHRRGIRHVGLLRNEPSGPAGLLFIQSSDRSNFTRVCGGGDASRIPGTPINHYSNLFAQRVGKSALRDQVRRKSGITLSSNREARRQTDVRKSYNDIDRQFRPPVRPAPGRRGSATPSRICPGFSARRLRPRPRRRGTCRGQCSPVATTPARRPRQLRRCKSRSSTTRCSCRSFSPREPASDHLAARL